jgi:hypothetical protein
MNEVVSSTGQEIPANTAVEELSWHLAEIGNAVFYEDGDTKAEVAKLLALYGWWESEEDQNDEGGWLYFGGGESFVGVRVSQVVEELMKADASYYLMVLRERLEDQGAVAEEVTEVEAPTETEAALVIGATAGIGQSATVEQIGDALGWSSDHTEAIVSQLEALGLLAGTDVHEGNLPA